MKIHWNIIRLLSAVLWGAIMLIAGIKAAAVFMAFLVTVFMLVIFRAALKHEENDDDILAEEDNYEEETWTESSEHPPGDIPARTRRYIKCLLAFFIFRYLFRIILTLPARTTAEAVIHGLGRLQQFTMKTGGIISRFLGRSDK